MLKNIEFIIYDFDGVMTDNRAFIFEDGKEAVLVNRADGLAVGLIKDMGIAQIIVSTETNPVVKARARKLGIPLMQSVMNKKKAVEEHLKKIGVNKKNVIFVGNDINDKEVMEFVGHPIAPADASEEIKKIAKIITAAKGGAGVVREIFNILRRSR